MKNIFPLKIYRFNKEQENNFDKYFCESNNEFYFEGMWFRNQRPENKKASDYVDETTQRRRYIHFYNTYKNINHCFALCDAYLIVSNTLPKEENEEYLNRILSALNKKHFEKIDDCTWELGNLQIIIKQYDNHPKNSICEATFPENYNSVDVIAVTKGYDYIKHYHRMWEHSTKLYRMPDKRENPLYVTDLEEIKKYLPAQVEMGCGPSIEAKIEPLYKMHEMYKVQNHETGKFYFGKQDDLIERIILNPKKQYKVFSSTPKRCINAKHTTGYKIFNELYKKGVFIGTVYNNNFDRLVKRFDIPEIILRTYQKDIYIQKINFDKKAKSLICFGAHADRRQVEKQARENGLKVIFVDPEGFYNKTFEPYPIEGPKDEDIILKMKFEDAMKLFKKDLLNN